MIVSDAAVQWQREFYWGLSLGIIILTVAGFIWFAWAISAFASVSAAGICGALDVAFAACLVFGARRVRRKADGFRRSDLSRGTPGQRATSRRINRGFLLISAGEWIGICLAAFATYRFGRGDLFPPALSLIVALHFFPLASLFRRRFYLVTAAAGSLLSLVRASDPVSSALRRCAPHPHRGRNGRGAVAYRDLLHTRGRPPRRRGPSC